MMGLDTLLKENILLFQVIWGITLALLLVMVAVGMVRNLQELGEYRRMMTRRIYKLRLGGMLDYLGISVRDYLLKTTELDKERHMRHCKTCSSSDKCDCLLRGEDLDPASFCPNYHELEKL